MNKDGRWLGILLSWVLGLALSMPHPVQAAPATILVMGDSLSAGYGIKVENGWVALLGKRLAQQGYEYQLVNASVSGETSGGGKVRLPALLSTHKPAIVILELGANDGLRGLPNTQLRSNLNAMIDAAQQAKAKVLLVGMQIPPNYGQTYTTGFKAVFTDLAAARRLTLVPFFLDGVALDTKLMQGDNLHPNEQGQPKLLENIWPGLRTLLKR
ncbi:MAG: arylesterase [Steroidobacteraceae bacterium]